MADALVVAGVAGGDAWQRAQREYFKRCPRPYMRLVAAIQDSDFLSALPASDRAVDVWFRVERCLRLCILATWVHDLLRGRSLPAPMHLGRSVRVAFFSPCTGMHA